MVVSDSLATHCWSESIVGSGCNGSSSFSPGSQSSTLSSSLIEPDSDVSLPMLSEVDIREHVIMFNHCQ